MPIRRELSDRQWELIAPLLPPERGRWARPAKDNRLMVNGILWILRTGAPWRDLPSQYGPWNSIYTRFSCWSKVGIWEQVLEVLSQDRDGEAYMLDSSVIRAHQHSEGAKGGRTIRLSAAPAAGSPPKSTPSSMH